MVNFVNFLCFLSIALIQYNIILLVENKLIYKQQKGILIHIRWLMKVPVKIGFRPTDTTNLPSCLCLNMMVSYQDAYFIAHILVIHWFEKGARMHSHTSQDFSFLQVKM